MRSHNIISQPDGELEPLADSDRDARLWMDCELCTFVENRFHETLEPAAIGGALRDEWCRRAVARVEHLVDPRAQDYRSAFWIVDRGTRVGTIALEAGRISAIAPAGPLGYNRIDSRSKEDVMRPFCSFAWVLLVAAPACGEGTGVSSDAGAGRWVHEESGTTEELRALAATGDHRVVAVGWGRFALEREAAAWRRIDLSPLLERFLEPAEFERLWTDGDDVYATGQVGFYVGGLLRREATGWSIAWAEGEGGAPSLNGGPLRGICGPSEGELVAAAGGGDFVVREGAGWRIEVDVAPPGSDIAVDPNGTLILLGDRIYHGTLQQGFSAQSGEDAAYLRAVWSVDATTAVAVGRGGAIFHLVVRGVERSWARAESGVDVDLFGVWGARANSIYAVGRDGTILYWDGTAWTALESGVQVDLFAVRGAPSGDIYVAGEQGTILRLAGGSAL